MIDFHFFFLFIHFYTKIAYWNIHQRKHVKWTTVTIISTENVMHGIQILQFVVVENFLYSYSYNYLIKANKKFCFFFFKNEIIVGVFNLIYSKFLFTLMDSLRLNWFDSNQRLNQNKQTRKYCDVIRSGLRTKKSEKWKQLLLLRMSKRSAEQSAGFETNALNTNAMKDSNYSSHLA